MNAWNDGVAEPGRRGTGTSGGARWEGGAQPEASAWGRSERGGRGAPRKPPFTFLGRPRCVEGTGKVVFPRPPLPGGGSRGGRAGRRPRTWGEGRLAHATPPGSATDRRRVGKGDAPRREPPRAWVHPASAACHPRTREGEKDAGSRGRACSWWTTSRGAAVRDELVKHQLGLTKSAFLLFSALD